MFRFHRPAPKAVAAPLEVTVEELYSGCVKEMDLDELGDAQMKELGFGGKVTCTVTKGMREGERIPFPGMGVKLPGMEQRGDFTAVVRVTEHERFKMENDDDLLMTHEITLVEALCGFTHEIRHIDGTLLLVTTPSPTPPQSIKKIPEKGLPTSPDGSTPPGDLLISFTVIFPIILDPEQIAAVHPLLPSRHMVPLYDEDKVLPVEMNSITREDWAAKLEQEDSSDEDDDDGMHFPFFFFQQ
eukprot:TRINITY_DN20762_c0_g1_i1.p1 TRINITY_DN20762_c0_g1~~TRINITY_DN20762_c0_g1_i1.p1  ORF type:complete len:255 (+),score=56.06 TRINITY_DN20762_c0_g1_i1:40-765(+)